jgi:hypothetical protein
MCVFGLFRRYLGCGWFVGYICLGKRDSSGTKGMEGTLQVRDSSDGLGFIRDSSGRGLFR